MQTFDIIARYWEGFASGIRVTLLLAFWVWSIGLFLGSVLGYVVDRYTVVVRPVFAVIAFILTGVPVIVLLVWAHYPLQVLLNVVVDPFFTACWVLSLVNVFTVGGIVSSSLKDFPVGYTVAAQVCGLPPFRMFLRIKFPIIFRQILPSLITSQVVILQATLFASLISVEEIFRVSQRINATAYKPVEIYTALALFFLMICLPLNGLSLWLRRRFTVNYSLKY